MSQGKFRHKKLTNLEIARLTFWAHDHSLRFQYFSEGTWVRITGEKILIEWCPSRGVILFGEDRFKVERVRSLDEAFSEMEWYIGQRERPSKAFESIDGGYQTAPGYMTSYGVFSPDPNFSIRPAYLERLRELVTGDPT